MDAALEPVTVSPVEPADPRSDAAVTLRDPAPGDYGWVIEQHGAIYAREYGWDASFEGLVAEVVGRFVARFDPASDRAWIAEHGGQRCGSVFIVRKSKTVAQLRLLILTPEARGLGIGGRLVDAGIDFARERGFKRLVLWTNANLQDARELYRRRGFLLTRSAPYVGYGGHALVGETWELRL